MPCPSRLTWPVRLLALCALAASSPALASEAPSVPRVREGAVVDTLPVVEITDTFDRSVRRVLSSSQHALTAAEIGARPVFRAGEILEAVPGVAISQHSGEGKANQYYLRGFNLDHGTDLALFVSGVPVNMPTHGHGQGYADLNFLIPELVGGVEYKKGTYFADEGDFGSAGAAHVAYANRLERPMLTLGIDDFGYRRALLAGSTAIARGDLLAALDVSTNDGPWLRPDDFRKVNGLLRWGRNGPASGFRFTAMAYDGRWNSTDQIPERAVRSGSLARYGLIDPTDGGSSHRYSLSADWQRFSPNAITQATAYAMDYRMNLFSNFTYFLDDTAAGDQFEQADDRIVTGLRASHRWRSRIGSRTMEHLAGLHVRRDDIAEVGLYHTAARSRLATTRRDRVEQTSASPFAQTTLDAAPWLRATAGLRADAYWFRVASDQPLNSGRASASIVSPKFGLSLGPWARTALFGNFGTGFHSNDARGTTITVDPATGDPAERVDPLVRSTGFEGGLVSAAIRGIETSITVWRLDLESELLFIGDAGNTEASRPSRRTGIEWTSAWAPVAAVRVDADVAYSRARFTDFDPAGDRIPGAVEGVASAGITLLDARGFFGATRLRYFGPRPLIEDDRVRSRASTIVNAELGRSLGPWGRLSVEAFNLFDAEVSDIDYFYASRLPGEAAEGVEDLHTHPQAPRTVRVRLSASWPRARGRDTVPRPNGHPRGENGGS